MRKLLVANRGEIARRVIAGARSRGIATVAVFSDADAGLPFVREADESVRLPGNAPADTYLRIDLLLDAARRTGADALHPGYGFLSENPALATECAAAGICFVGPSPEAIASMGSKLAAKEMVRAAGVPTLESVAVPPGAESSLLSKMVAGIGLPVLVKASAGGGGRGMRVVEDVDSLAEVVASAQREAQSAFGDGTVFLERYLRRPRHVEIQVVGDSHGTVTHLFERECSIQRRHQKIVEESPSPVMTPELRQAMGEAAVAAARSVDYVGVGTVEFLVDQSGEYFFLEMNTRLQVEHPVTEAITGIDLVGLQLAVAGGEPLPPSALAPSVSGHAIEVRLYAEDPTDDWMPSTGTLHMFEIPGTGSFALDGGLRLDSGFETGSVVSPHYDPMLAKVIAWGETRQLAAARLAGCLARARIHGVGTNRDLLVGILRHPEFLGGGTDTAFLSRHDPSLLGASPVDEHAERLHAGAAAIAAQVRRRSQSVGFAGFPSGWRNNPSDPQSISYRGHQGDIEIAYRVTRDGVVFPDAAGVGVASATEDEVVMDVGGIHRPCRVHLVGDTAYVDSMFGASVLTEIPRFPEPMGHHHPGSLLSPIPGSVVRVEVSQGDHVDHGATLVVMEAMKMEHTLSAPFSGTVTEVRAQAGDQVDADVVLVVLKEDE